SQSPRRRRSQ
nr:Chain A, HBV-NLS [Hepatitis B virus]